MVIDWVSTPVSLLVNLFLWLLNLLSFSLFSSTSRALGFAATRGKLYYRHPELFKVRFVKNLPALWRNLHHSPRKSCLRFPRFIVPTRRVYRRPDIASSRPLIQITGSIPWVWEGERVGCGCVEGVCGDRYRTVTPSWVVCVFAVPGRCRWQAVVVRAELASHHRRKGKVLTWKFRDRFVI